MRYVDTNYSPNLRQKMNKQKELERTIAASLTCAARAEAQAETQPDAEKKQRDIEFARNERENAARNQQRLYALMSRKKEKGID